MVADGWVGVKWAHEKCTDSGIGKSLKADALQRWGGPVGYLSVAAAFLSWPRLIVHTNWGRNGKVHIS